MCRKLFGIQKIASSPTPPKCSHRSFQSFRRLHRNGSSVISSYPIGNCPTVTSHWRPDAIAAPVLFHSATVYNMQENIFVYGTVRPPTFRARGAPQALHQAAEDSLIAWLEEQPWAMQKEMGSTRSPIHGIQSTEEEEVECEEWPPPRLSSERRIAYAFRGRVSRRHRRATRLHR